MANRILLYGATGFSGGLIAAEARRRLDGGADDVADVVLGGRDRHALHALSDVLGLDSVVFALDDRVCVEAVLQQFDVVLNAAGPFAHTALRLAKCAIATGCHYVDINGEVDVYQALDDLEYAARTRRVAVVSGAGFTSMVSDVMLDRALALLTEAGWRGAEVNVRIAVTRMADFSRGSMVTMLRSVREEVVTVRRGAFAHVPVGRLERTFDFGMAERTAPAGPALRTAPPPSRRIASALNLLDTLTAFHTVRRHHRTSVGAIESYVDMPRPVRLAYQAGALSTALFQLPLAQRLARLQLAQLPDGPDETQRRQGRERVLVTVENQFGEPWVDWRVETPNAYDVTAACALSVAARLAAPGLTLSGWVTPAQVVPLPDPPSSLSDGNPWAPSTAPFTGWTLEAGPVFRVTS